MQSLDVAMSSVTECQTLDGFRLDRDQITIVRLIGSGNFGQVSKAIYGPSQSEAAVKSLKGIFLFSLLLLSPN